MNCDDTRGYVYDFLDAGDYLNARQIWGGHLHDQRLRQYLQLPRRIRYGRCAACPRNRAVCIHLEGEPYSETLSMYCSTHSREYENRRLL